MNLYVYMYLSVGHTVLVCANLVPGDPRIIMHVVILIHVRPRILIDVVILIHVSPLILIHVVIPVLVLARVLILSGLRQ